MAEQLQPLFNQLSTRLKAGDHSAAVQVCDQILAAAPGDADALHAKMVSLIELSRVEDALLLADSSPPLTDIVRFERAYCLYQLHREQESLALLMPAGVAPSEVREMQLAAQIFYRLGEYGQAADLFRQAEATGGPSAELSTNILAALVLAGRSADGVEYAKTTAGADEPGDKPHELVYNYACAAIEQGQMRTAKQLLQKAIELCRRTMAEGEDWSEEEVEVRAACRTPKVAFSLRLACRPAWRPPLGSLGLAPQEAGPPPPFSGVPEEHGATAPSALPPLCIGVAATQPDAAGLPPSMLVAARWQRTARLP